MKIVLLWKKSILNQRRISHFSRRISSMSSANISALKTEGLLSGEFVLGHAAPVAGFLVRPDAPNHGNYPGAYIWTGKFVTYPGKADEAIAALKENLPYVESSEPETISFLVLKGIDEEDVVYVWERYTSESALRDIHHQSPGYLKLREKTGKLYKSRSINGYYEVAGFLTREGGLL
jgi:quinol monooxygenase YgiN